MTAMNQLKGPNEGIKRITAGRKVRSELEYEFKFETEGKSKSGKERRKLSKPLPVNEVLRSEKRAPKKAGYSIRPMTGSGICCVTFFALSYDTFSPRPQNHKPNYKRTRDKFLMQVRPIVSYLDC